MPAFGKSLSDAEIAAVLAYIKSNWPVEIQRRQSRLNEKR
jgi:mono/diheme cytochrome c family protein